jgi:endogenous inhibitor of DNA gyrase (YacG/DUF329 family)
MAVNPARWSSKLKPSSPSSKQRLRPCPICRSEYQVYNSLNPGCSTECRIEVRRQKQLTKAAKDERRQDRMKAIKLRTRSEWLRLTQGDCNAYIRLRDEGKPCISCGKPIRLKRNAGHYLSVGSHPELRFNEFNINLQDERCNSYLSGNSVEYRKGLIERYGIKIVEWLEGPHQPKHYSIDELERLRAEFRAKAKALKAMRERAYD